MKKLTIAYLTPFPTDALLRLQNSGIILHDICFVSDYEFQFCIENADRHIVNALAKRHGDEVKILHISKQFFSLRRFLARPVLLLGFIFVLFLTFWVPSRVFFIQVEGNRQISTTQIVQALQNCGVRFGSSRKTLRSQSVKDALLHEIPQLQWAGINTNGCVAVIQVQERNEQARDTNKTGVSSIVASHDGVVSAITVLEGNALCKPGDAVKAGQVLISGYQDLGICISAVHAEGEVYAYTKRAVSVISPSVWSQKLSATKTQTNYFLIIGKNRINFHNSSGILGSSCAKIYVQKYITLPGGFVLPVAIASETYFYYETEDAMQPAMETCLHDFAGNYLLQTMQAGQILYTDEAISQTEEIYRLDGIYGCHEMIGRSRPEENLPDYEDN